MVGGRFGLAWLFACGLLLGCGTPGAARSAPAAYLRAEHPALVIELDVAPGLMPSDAARARMTEAIAPLLAKPGGIRVEPDDTLPASAMRSVWTFEALTELAASTFDAMGEEDEAVFQTLWLPGSYANAEGANVLGIAWANRHVAIFAERVAESCVLPGRLEDRLCPQSEAAIWAHEVGHVLGLVNAGIPMVEDHEDPNHPGHTSDEEGLMYWAYERPRLVELLRARMGSEELFAFGAASLADAAAFRGR